uniref:Uncharacterized protein n=1 Tax=Anguilla anguilla TaxID=7936 RepID=A0A0E9WFP1_ANGAN
MFPVVNTAVFCSGLSLSRLYVNEGWSRATTATGALWDASDGRRGTHSREVPFVRARKTAEN